MKLLICATEYYPYGSGIANVAYNVVEQLKKKGVDCKVCSPTGPDIKLGSYKFIQRCGILGLMYYWYEVYNYFKNKELDFDVIWCHNPLFFTDSPFSNFFVTMNSTYYGKIKNSNSNFFIHFYKTTASFIEKYSLNHLNSSVKFTGVGQQVCKELEEMGIDKKRIVYIPNGVNTKLFKPSKQKNILRTNFNIPEDNLILLSVGRLTEVKRPLKLIETFSIIEKEIPNISLVVAGDGELLDSATKFAKKIDVKNILFLGHVDHKTDAPDLYACSDCFIMASKYEGGEPPLTLSEAMASGLPCIVSDIFNFKIVEDCNCGVIVDFSNVQNAGEKIIDFLKNDHSEESINARKFTLQNLDWCEITEVYLKQFENMVLKVPS